MKHTLYLSTLLVLVCIIHVYATPLRGVKICKYPECVQISVNAEKAREVFVTECRINKVYVHGDSSTITIRDAHNRICGKYIHHIILEKT